MVRSSKAEAEKIKNEIARVNIRDVLLFLFLWPYMFFSTILRSFLSLLQQVFKVGHKRHCSTNGNIRTQIPVRPTMMSTNNRLSTVLKLSLIHI